MNARELQDLLRELLDDVAMAAGDEDSPVAEIADRLGLSDVYGFDAVGMLTRDAGLVVVLGDGSEFQLTIVRSRGPGS